ncbi:aminotransferase class III-fold pyridoxal phosphate-dependent enzyme [Micromonospora sp. URMC 103]|uniref:aminotransferase class III-fold pyridoxal phosphate-dependent enzyme n=1 Tax=Micromonospora sp. URMC 103 TaxID=3423406 RepID=UPI003F1BDA68
MTAWWAGEARDADEQRRHLLDGYAARVADDLTAPLLALRAPVSVIGADGDTVRGADGSAYVDLRCGAGSAALGHRPPPVVAALHDALGSTDIGDQQLPSTLRVDLATALGATLPHGPWRWQFCGSGSEAAEFALRTAMAVTGRSRLVALEDGYHGRTGLAAAVTDPRHLPGPYPRLAVEPVRIPPEGEAGLSRVDDGVAAVIVEPVQLTDRVRPLDPEWLRALRRRCDRAGAILVLDEVKSGLGRCGPVWAHEASGVVPDMLLVGKALSGGLYPVAAYGLRDDGPLRGWRSPLRSSYGGSLLGMAVGTAALAQLVDPANRRRHRRTAEALERRLRRHLSHLGASAPRLTRHGAAFALTFDEPDTALFVAADLLHRRVLVPMPAGDTIVLLPPLTISTATAETACARIAAAVTAAATALRPGQGATAC